MADRNPLWVSHTGGVITVDDISIGVGSLWTPGSSNVNSRMGLRPGGTTTTATPAYVAAQGTPDKTVKVNAFQAVIPRSRATGCGIVTHDAANNIDLLTAHPAHATLQRNDLIVAQYSDEAFDSANGFSVFQVVGTPNASPTDPAVNTTNGAPTNSPDYIVLARVRVTANASTITNSMIDLFPNGKQWTVATGGVIPIANATDRATLTPYEGMTIWRIDRGWLETYSVVLTGWIVQGPAVCSSISDATTTITTPYTGQIVIIGAWNYYWDGTAFVLRPGQLVGGQLRTTNAAAVAGTETVVLTTPSLSLDRQSTYEIAYYLNGADSAIGDDFDMRIRVTNLAGSISTEEVLNRSDNAYPYGKVIYAQYSTTVAETKVWVGTVQRITGSGTFTAQTGSWIRVTKIAPAGTFSTI